MVSSIAPTFSCTSLSITSLILDLLVDGRLGALRRNRYIRANNLQNEGSIGIVLLVQSSGLILNKVVTVTQARDGVGTNTSRDKITGISMSGGEHATERRGICLSIRGITALSSQILGNSCSILVLNQSISAFSSKLALVNTRTPYNIAQGTVCAKVASENLVCLVRVSRLGRADSDSMCPLSRHGGGGAGDSGDSHCRGGCHSDEALENLVHCSPFLSCLKS